MRRQDKSWLLAAIVIGAHTLGSASASMAQVQRYEPNRPTVSPYLNLFRRDLNNGPLPNYQALVRPLQQQYETNQVQQRSLQQQNRALRQLNSNVQDVERRAATGQLVAPTGHGAWFGRPASRAGYLNTSRFYSQSGTAGINAGASAGYYPQRNQQNIGRQAQRGHSDSQRFEPSGPTGGGRSR